MDTSDALEKLIRRKKNMESEISLLSMNSICFVRSPSQTCDDKEHIFNAEKELEIINLAINELESVGKDNAKNNVGIIKKSAKIPNVTQNPTTDKPKSKQPPNGISLRHFAFGVAIIIFAAIAISSINHYSSISL